MTIEQALRELSGMNATISFRSMGGVMRLSIAARGHRVAWAYDPAPAGLCNLSVLSWKIVMLTRALRRRIFMANVMQRLKDLFGSQNRAGLTVSVSDLVQFAQIVDDELDRMEACRQAKDDDDGGPQDGKGLVDQWGQTETKEA